MKTRLFIISAIAIIIAYSCSDIFETNLEKKDIELVAPYNGAILYENTQTFWWSEVKGAEEYNLQIATPDFSEIQKIVLDTNITDLKFTYYLSPGVYQWRVRAVNNTSYTDYVTYNLTISIDSNINLTEKTVSLNSPINNYATNNDTSYIEFKWYQLDSADDYRFEIRDGNWDDGNVILREIVTETSYEVNIVLEEGIYSWAVRGENSISSSNYSVPRYFEVDITAPNTPLLSFPANNAVIANDSSFTFSWSRGIETGTTIKDSFFIYNDTLMTDVKFESFQDNPSYTVDSLETGNYFWRVRSIDMAGNKSNYSSLRKLIIN